MKLYLTPWLPIITVFALIAGSLLSTLVLPPESAGFVFQFFASLYLHFLAIVIYGLSLYFILMDTNTKRVFIATGNALFSLYIWYYLVNFLTDDFIM